MRPLARERLRVLGRYLPPLLKPAKRPACLRALFRPQVRRRSRNRRIQSLGAYVGDLIRNETHYPWSPEEKAE